MDKVYKKLSKKWNQPYNPTKEDLKFRYNLCKKTFCNSKCEGYPFQIKHKNGFQIKDKNGFKKKYTIAQIDKLKERGALSGCVNISDYNVFHK